MLLRFQMGKFANLVCIAEGSGGFSAWVSVHIRTQLNNEIYAQYANHISFSFPLLLGYSISM